METMAITNEPTLEMVFKCTVCGARRQYGCGDSVITRPELETVTISCKRCQQPTWHEFDRVVERSGIREIRVACWFRRY